jgi:hypothetical protein
VRSERRAAGLLDVPSYSLSMGELFRSELRGVRSERRAAGLLDVSSYSLSVGELFRSELRGVRSERRAARPLEVLSCTRVWEGRASSERGSSQAPNARSHSSLLSTHS